MIKMIVRFWWILFFLVGMRAPDNPWEADAWYAELEQRLTQDIAAENGVEKLEDLKEYLMKLGARYPHSDERWNALFIKAQQATVAFPNHAQYFRDQINALFDPVTNERTKESGNDQRYLIRETLCHIPSPQVVQLLGEMLEDERGKIDDPKNRFGATSNADFACCALMLIGLENMPVPRGTGMLPVESAYYRKDTWKLWWGPIKAGNRAFSFEGQDVEYRFRKDGTYETLPRSGAQKRNTQDVAGGVENHSAKIGKPTQRWLILLAGCAALFAWLRWRTQKRAA